MKAIISREISSVQQSSFTSGTLLRTIEQNVVLRIPFFVRVHKSISNLLYEEIIVVPFIVIKIIIFIQKIFIINIKQFSIIDNTLTYFIINKIMSLLLNFFNIHYK